MPRSDDETGELDSGEYGSGLIGEFKAEECKAGDVDDDVCL